MVLATSLTVAVGFSISYSELHALRTSSTKLAGHDDFAALGTGLHDEAQDTIAGATNSQAVEQLVAQGLALSDSGETAVLHLGGVERDGVLGELEALLNQGGELADAAALLAQNFLSVGCADDCGALDSDISVRLWEVRRRTDIGDSGSHADLDTGVTLLGQLTLEKLVQLGVENTIGDELSALRDSTLLSGHVGRLRW